MKRAICLFLLGIYLSTVSSYLEQLPVELLEVVVDKSVGIHDEASRSSEHTYETLDWANKQFPQFLKVLQQVNRRFYDLIVKRVAQLQKKVKHMPFVAADVAYSYFMSKRAIPCLFDVQYVAKKSAKEPERKIKWAATLEKDIKSNIILLLTIVFTSSDHQWTAHWHGTYLEAGVPTSFINEVIHLIKEDERSHIVQYMDLFTQIFTENSKKDGTQYIDSYGTASAQASFYSPPITSNIDLKYIKFIAENAFSKR